MAFERGSLIGSIAISVAYLAGYVFLDWVSFVFPLAPYGVTPWNPPTGLSLALVLLVGLRGAPLLFVGPLLGNLATRQLSLPLPVELFEVSVIGICYTAASVLLLRPSLCFDHRLMSMRDLLLLLAVAVASAGAVSLANVTVLAVSGLLPWSGLPIAAARYWIGEVIGICIVTPFVLFLFTRQRPSASSWETVCQFIAIMLALWLVFWGAQANQFQWFYALFLPIVWIAVRSGIEGVSTGIVVTQSGLILAIRFSPHSDIDVTSYQAVMLVLALTGLAAGMLVSERRRLELELRRQRDALAHVARLGSMGQLAAAIAHEINQPLTASGIYTRLVRDSLKNGSEGSAAAMTAADRAVAQIDRAAEVVRRLRDLVRVGRSDVRPIGVQRIVREAVEHFQPDLKRAGILVRTDVARDIDSVMADMLQIQQVLLNLLRNSVEAMVGEAHGKVKGKVTIEAALGTPGFVELRVRDTGPGFTAVIADGDLLPFSSTKPEGLGMGLSLSRTIVEAHGGKLWLAGGSTGAVVHFTLPLAGKSDYDR